MQDTDTKRFEMFLRVREFGTERDAEFPPTSFAGERLATLGEIINGLETHASAQFSGLSGSRQGGASKSAALDEVVRDMEAINRTARSMALTIPGLDDKFRMPRNRTHQAVIAAARAFHADATPLRDEFVRRGLPADFLTDLESDINAFEEANTSKIQSRETHVAATAAIEELIENGMRIVRELDAVMRNLYANSPSNLAAWLSASHVERPPRRAKVAPTPPAT
jgi:hypothetical protein